MRVNSNLLFSFFKPQVLSTPIGLSGAFSCCICSLNCVSFTICCPSPLVSTLLVVTAPSCLALLPDSAHRYLQPLLLHPPSFNNSHLLLPPGQAPQDKLCFWNVLRRGKPELQADPAVLAGFPYQLGSVGKSTC